MEFLGIVELGSLLEPSQVVVVLCGAGHVWQFPLEYVGAGHVGVEASRNIYSPVGSIGVIVLQPTVSPRMPIKDSKYANIAIPRRFSLKKALFRQVRLFINLI